MLAKTRPDMLNLADVQEIKQHTSHELKVSCNQLAEISKLSSTRVKLHKFSANTKKTNLRKILRENYNKTSAIKITYFIARIPSSLQPSSNFALLLESAGSRKIASIQAQPRHQPRAASKASTSADFPRTHHLQHSAKLAHNDVPAELKS